MSTTPAPAEQKQGQEGEQKGQQPQEPNTQQLAAQAKDPMGSLNFGEEIKKMIATAGTLKLTDKQKKILEAPVKDEDVYIKPDGLIYLSWFKYSERLSKAFGGTGWAMVPEGNAKLGRELIIWGFHLVIQGVYCGFAYGEQKYTAAFSKMSFGEACEGAKSNALMRLCKGIGIGLELFDKDFINNWLSKYAEWYWDGDKKKWKLKRDSFGKTPDAPTQAAQEPAAHKEKVTPPAPEGKKATPVPAPAVSAPAKAQAERKSQAKKTEAADVPMERIEDSEIVGTEVKAEVTEPKIEEPKPGETQRVLEAVRKLEDCPNQKILQKVFAEIKSRYNPGGYTKDEQEVLRIKANQLFVKLGAGRH
jgi:ribosomal protein L17